jgi:hypothetical protein
MTPEQKAAYVIAQAACAVAELGAMEAANALARQDNLPPPYSADNLRALSDQYCIGRNAVLTLFEGRS